ncbi:MAG: hypothetical protein A2Y21_07740 [Clostridiales bacterium GWC2_40_7]|nr:MAG: hypothetical protein A2Y21_07740 [Clostridiales bacterium GWC2_40_7]
MVMNLYILFLVSLPEAFLNLIIILIFAGQKEKLKINRQNVIRFIVSLVAMLTASYIIRPLIPNIPVINIILHSLAYIIILTIVYRLKLIYSILSILFAELLMTTFENMYVPFIIAYISKGIENFSRDYQLYVIYAIPTRIFQVLVIAYLWKYEILMASKINRSFHKAFILSIIILVTIENFIAYIFYTMFNTLSLTHQILFAVALVLMILTSNFIMFASIYIAIGKIIQNGYTRYNDLEENAKVAFDIIRKLIKADKASEAIEIIDNLRS